MLALTFQNKGNLAHSQSHLGTPQADISDTLITCRSVGYRSLPYRLLTKGMIGMFSLIDGMFYLWCEWKFPVQLISDLVLLGFGSSLFDILRIVSI